MTRVLIIAYGNPLRCDDGLGWHAAEQLSRALPPEIEIVTCHQLTPELAHNVSQAAGVLFIDAARGDRAGEVVSVAIQPKARSGAFTHEFSPAAVLELAGRLYGRTPKAFAVSLCGKCFGHGEFLSQEVQEGLPRLVETAAGLSVKMASGQAQRER